MQTRACICLVGCAALLLYCSVFGPRRVVVLRAAIKSSKGPKNGKLYTEDDWNETATLEDSPYLLSKVHAHD